MPRRPRRTAARCLHAAACALLLCNAAAAAKPPVTAVAFTPDGKLVLAGSQSGISVLDWPGLKQRRSVKTDLKHVHDLAFSPDGKWLLAAGGSPAESGGFELYSWPDAKRTGSANPHDDVVFGVAWTPDSNGWATAGLDHAVMIFQRGNAEPLVSIDGHSRGVKTVGLLEGGKTLVSGGIDNSLRVWSLKSGGGKPTATAVRAFNNHTRPIHDLAVRPAEDDDALPMVATVSEDRTVRFWQPTIGRMVRFVRLEKTQPLAVRWTPDGKFAVVCCDDGGLRVVDPDAAEIKQTVAALKGWAYCVDVHPDGKAAVVGGGDGAVKRVELLPAK